MGPRMSIVNRPTTPKARLTLRQSKKGGHPHLKHARETTKGPAGLSAIREESRKTVAGAMDTLRFVDATVKDANGGTLTSSGILHTSGGGDVDPPGLRSRPKTENLLEVGKRGVRPQSSPASTGHFIQTKKMKARSLRHEYTQLVKKIELHNRFGCWVCDKHLVTGEGGLPLSTLVDPPT